MFTERGELCAPITEDRADELQLSPIVANRRMA